MSLDLSLYLVTDAALSGPRGVAVVVAESVAGGARIVQLRDKHATDAEVVEQLVELSAVIDGRALLVVDDRLDAALEARRRGARVDGVHVGQSDASVLDARAALGPDAIVGLTANRPEHLDAARALPAGTVDYLGVGVVHPTTTKANHPPALGVDGWAAFTAHSPLPCVAIGGIGLDDVAPLRAAGAAGVAVVSAICAADDPRATSRAFLRAWHGGRAPRVLSIAGSDPSGGAGIQADLKSIAANGGYGMAAITALTAQSTQGVRSVHVPPADFLGEQLDALADDVDIDAVKIGMLADAEIIRTVREWLDRVRPETVVLDPVMVATSGDRLLDAAAEDALRGLLPLADVVTPNLPELAVLAGEPQAGDWEQALEQAARLSERYGVLVLVKGGHLDSADAPDALVGPDGALAAFSDPRIVTDNTHGTGCSLSSALASRRARGADWPTAVAEARAWLRESIAAGSDLDVGRGHGPVSHFAGLWARGGIDTVPTAERVADDWWQRIAGIRRGIDDLPFIRALADGTLPRDAFVFYLGQDALYLREYARVLAAAASLAPTSTEQAFWAQGAQGAIAGELELHESWLSEERTFAADPGPVTTAYLDHLRSVAFGGDYAELVAAVLPCYWLYADLGERLGAGDFGAHALDPDHPYASWLATYADPAFAEANRRAIAIVTAAAADAAPETRARMYAAFERAAQLELDFFAAPLPEAAAVL
ncbi:MULTISPECIES: bifunctional hydroxymethylpyrimidine kinase/phosphomethylpyrimidine kinase [unclassified Microbacterium]|uniref:bifunctional hydroxymethylpyrimidine kinase/phosphomethylpyrimidine kinase n=1 Tax=unclassified Microbacterium TaxID=2609290 RepID=UPI0012F941BF|nr:bifunctional hydroxymethylpyrimidine kinase/phosphomethylpyrimidine kinase [Microbacterium sp. MAH-37]MVQ41011.1 bifunctional hydroxymethylpyrimidine kinase/phosphomethylpyrimidine kinase [Microbacterium sp. MAH-37]